MKAGWWHLDVVQDLIPGFIIMHFKSEVYNIGDAASNINIINYVLCLRAWVEIIYVIIIGKIIFILIR